MSVEITGTTRVCGLIGNPVQHTFSPAIHNPLAAAMGINLVYVAFHVQDPATLGDAVTGAYNLNVLGMNVTVPYKSQVMPYLKEIDPTAAAIGACNTLVRVNGGYKGYNTDYLGLARAIEDADAMHENVVLVGAGGAARAAGFVCGTRGVKHLVILNRTIAKAGELADDLLQHFPEMDIQVMPLSAAGSLPEYGDGKYLAIQCTNIGLAPDVDEAPITDPAFYSKLSYAYDCIYTPEETMFLQLAAQQGVPGACGIDMLLWQGVLAYELWTGTTPTDEEVEVARQGLRGHFRKQHEQEAQGAVGSPDQQNPVTNKAQAGNLVIVGFMGSGKTTIGDALATAAGMPHKDTDVIIEESAGTTISEIFRQQGEKAFRHLETRTLTILADTDTEPTVYSTGGGIVVEEINRPLLHQLGTVVWLRVRPETVIERLGDDNTRPLLAGPDRDKKVQDLIDARYKAYESSADIIVDVDGKTPQEIVSEILARVSGV